MKKLFTLASALLIFAGCGDEKDQGKVPVCKITAPVGGITHDLYEDLVIKGTASDEDGDISKLTLSIDGKTIESVTTAPFEYTVSAGDLSEKAMKITLYVEDEHRNSATDEINITIVDKSQSPTCAITAPEHGARLNVFAPFTVSGTGEAVTGEISKATLKINDDIIAGVTAVPFEYTVPAESYAVGAVSITLEVENNRGRTAKDMIAITLEDQNVAPTCSITAPAAGTSFEPEDNVVIKGSGSDTDGNIVRATLKIGTETVAAVTGVPFEYTMTEAQKQPGNVNIVLEVEDNNGKKATDQITIMILGRDRTFTDPRDGKVYKTVKLGAQEWFAENLAWLPAVYPVNEGSNQTGKENDMFYYVYGYEGSDVTAAKATNQYKDAGVLYNFWAVLNGAAYQSYADRMNVPSGIQGPCPAGWHVPSRGEWWVLQQWCNDQIPNDDPQNVTYNDSGGMPDNNNGARLIKNILKRLKKRDAGWATSSLWVEEFPGSADQPTDEWGFGMFPSGVRWQNGSWGYYSGEYQTNFYSWTPDWNDVTYPANPGGDTVGSGSKYELSYSNGGSTHSRAYSLRCVKD